MKRQLRQNGDSCLIGDLLEKYNQYDKAIIYYKCLLRELPAHYILVAQLKDKIQQNFANKINDLNKVDQRLRFATDEDLICQLADELYRHYTKEAQKYFHLGNVKMSNDQERLANRIYSELRNVHNNIITLENNNPSFVCPKTELIWLKSKMQDYANVDQLQTYFNELVSSYSSFYNQDDCQHYLRNDKNIGGIFLIIDIDYNESIVTTFEHLSNVKCLYRYGQSKSETKGIITNFDAFRYQLAYNLKAHYGDFGAECRAKNKL
ncbi:unnamed protein product [Rotaria socialis]|uniref:Uncharacterized protein n=1 Tax=Rotaria socialis TaxID=392032 RepID=A0A820KFH8_9BILA|nr:unnamed protein product [Rotaria socialis]CAF4343275.1 unnamed protein product [Rotaria socialis]